MVGGGTYMPLTPVHTDILPSIKATNNIEELRQRMPEMPQLPHLPQTPQMHQVRQLAVGRHG